MKEALLLFALSLSQDLFAAHDFEPPIRDADFIGSMCGSWQRLTEPERSCASQRGGQGITGNYDRCLRAIVVNGPPGGPPSARPMCIYIMREADTPQTYAERTTISSRTCYGAVAGSNQCPNYSDCDGLPGWSAVRDAVLESILEHIGSPSRTVDPVFRLRGDSPLNPRPAACTLDATPSTLTAEHGGIGAGG